LLTVVVGCGGTGSPTTTAPASTTEATTVTTVDVTPEPAPTTTLPPAPVPPSSPGYTFRQIEEATEHAVISVVYPVLDESAADNVAAVNEQLDNWARQMADDFIAAAADSGAAGVSTLEVQLAPELLSSTTFSLSGLSSQFDAATDFSLDSRIGWIFSIPDGQSITVVDLLVAGGLDRLATAARSHLIDDVLADPAAIQTPEGLLANPANFDAVWLTPTGIGVGFDQYQVTAGEAGSPSVLIPFAELEDVLETSGILAALGAGPTLPSDL
jgi:hypothetical protein